MHSTENPRPLTASPCGPLTGTAAVAGDKSISHRALILGAMAVGQTSISGLLEAEDVLNTAHSMRALGADVVQHGPGSWAVHGVGTGGFRQPAAPLDFGNSGTGSRLVMGAVATTPISVTFTGDASLQSRPMKRVVDPLSHFGTRYDSQPGGLMPLTVHGASPALAIDLDVAVASAQVKSALLLAALNASGTSRIRQAALTRDHTEKMLHGFGAKISVQPLPNGGEEIILEGEAELKACTIEVPRDPSSAAFPLVAALIVPGSNVLLPDILLNERRIGLVETLRDMGADITVENIRESGGEKIGDLRARASRLKGITVPAARAPAMIDEYPILAIAASFAEGQTTMLGLEELRVKESDRLAAIVAGLQANGVSVEEHPDSMVVTGQTQVPGGGMVETHLDHRIAMSFLVMGMASAKPVTVDDTAMIATSFPEFQSLMETLGADFQSNAGQSNAGFTKKAGA